MFLIFPRSEADVLIFFPNLRLGMFLKYSEIFEKSQSDVLINSLLIKKSVKAEVVVMVWVSIAMLVLVVVVRGPLPCPSMPKSKFHRRAIFIGVF